MCPVAQLEACDCCFHTAVPGSSVPHLAASSVPPPPTKQVTHLARVLGRMLRQTDMTPGTDNTLVTSGHCVEVPWGFNAYLPNQARFEDDLSATRLAAAICISPPFHGACLVTHQNGVLYNQLRYATGLLSSCAWLRDLIIGTTRQLHTSSAHNLCLVGCIVAARADHRLGDMTTDQAQVLSKSVATLESQLAGLHWSAVQHGLLLTDLKPNDVWRLIEAAY